jgi:hypothetical protein
LIAFHIGDEIIRVEELWGHSISMNFFLFETPRIRRAVEAALLAINYTLSCNDSMDQLTNVLTAISLPTRRAMIGQLAWFGLTIGHSAFLLTVDDIGGMKMQDSPAVKIALAHIDAWSRHDWDRTKELLAPNVHALVTTTMPNLGGSEFTGIDNAQGKGRAAHRARERSGDRNNWR